MTNIRAHGITMNVLRELSISKLGTIVHEGNLLNLNMKI